MKQNLITVAGLSHSGKDLLFNQLMKLGGTDPSLKIRENLVYFDWLTTHLRKNEGTYLEKLMPVYRWLNEKTKG